MSLTAAVWPQFATQVFRGGIGRLTCIGSYVNKQVTTFTFRAQPRRQQHVRNIILGQLWTQVASVHHEYGRLTLAVKLVSSACYDKQQVCVYLQPFSC